MLDWLMELLDKFKDVLLNVLPVSPFDKYISAMGNIPYLGWLNWLIPVKACMIIFVAWLSAVSLFYVYSIIMRWVKMIGD